MLEHLDEARLADARRAFDEHDVGRAARGLLERRPQLDEQGFAADEGRSLGLHHRRCVAARHRVLRLDDVDAEAIATACVALDRLPAMCVSDRTPCVRDGPRERARRHRGVRPQRVEQLVERNDPVARANQHTEQLEGFRLDRDRLSALAELAGVVIELVGAEAVDQQRLLTGASMLRQPRARISLPGAQDGTVGRGERGARGAMRARPDERVRPPSSCGRGSRG